jgi:hypothetical protein
VHGSVSGDEDTPPVIVPVKMLAGPTRRVVKVAEPTDADSDNSSSDDDAEADDAAAAAGGSAETVPAALCCVFHPAQPWIFAGFNDGVVRLFI